MGTALQYGLPMAGAAAQGFQQGAQLRTTEDQKRQEIALRASEEGRAKESHRVNMQQLGLAIQGMQNNLSLFPMQKEGMEQGLRQGRQVAAPYRQGLQSSIPGLQVPPDVNEYQAEQLAGNHLKVRGLNIAGMRAENSSDAIDPFARTVAQQQLQFAREQVREKRLEKQQLQKQLAGLDPYSDSYAEDKQELEFMLTEVERDALQYEEQVRAFFNELQGITGIATPAKDTGKKKLAPPPFKGAPK